MCVKCFCLSTRKKNKSVIYRTFSTNKKERKKKYQDRMLLFFYLKIKKNFVWRHTHRQHCGVWRVVRTFRVLFFLGKFANIFSLNTPNGILAVVGWLAGSGGGAWARGTQTRIRPNNHSCTRENGNKQRADRESLTNTTTWIASRTIWGGGRTLCFLVCFACCCCCGGWLGRAGNLTKWSEEEVI